MVGRVAICEDLIVVVVTFISTYSKLYHVRIVNVEESEVVRCLGTSCVCWKFASVLQLPCLHIVRGWTRRKCSVGCVADVYSRLWVMIQVYAYYF